MASDARRVALVCGPPCAGKTTLVKRSKQPGDLVADFDDVAWGLGSRGKWMHSAAIGDAAEREMWRLTAEVASLASGGAWVIRCAPDPHLRLELAELLRADRVIVLLPPLGVLLSRARQRPLAQETARAVRRWLDRYEPADVDELIRDRDEVG